ncbi:hypothetical protein C0J52_01292 [Blattella germanica]|nr:hypothetical protein C0J52_01292 [Blattella germanica]
MSKNDVLELPDEQLVERILKEIGLTKERVKEAVATLDNWLDLQPHLPKEKDDARLERWILRCKNSLEKTKQVLDLYYTLRGMSPDFMTDWDPKHQWFDDYYKSK